MASTKNAVTAATGAVNRLGSSTPAANPSVDDQAMVREGFAAVLAAEPDLEVVGQAANGTEAIHQTRQLQPDIVLMDVRMPVLDGLHATRQILGATAGDAGPRPLDADDI